MATAPRPDSDHPVFDHDLVMSRAARLTLTASAIFCVGTIYLVHYMQHSEREVRYVFATGDVLLDYKVSDSLFCVCLDNVQRRYPRRRTSLREDETKRGRFLGISAEA